MDPRLGISNKSDICETCGGDLQECNGHFGYVRLVLPAFHVGYFKRTIEILQDICKVGSNSVVDAFLWENMLIVSLYLRGLGLFQDLASRGRETIIFERTSTTRTGQFKAHADK